MDRWRAADKTGYDKLIRIWNRKMGTMKKIARTSYRVSTAFLAPYERRSEEKHRKSQRRKELFYNPILEWDEVPQKLPYRKGDDPNTILVEKSFIEMIRKQKRKEVQA